MFFLLKRQFFWNLSRPTSRKCKNGCFRLPSVIQKRLFFLISIYPKQNSARHPSPPSFIATSACTLSRLIFFVTEEVNLRLKFHHLFVWYCHEEIRYGSPQGFKRSNNLRGGLTYERGDDALWKFETPKGDQSGGGPTFFWFKKRSF